MTVEKISSDPGPPYTFLKIHHVIYMINLQEGMGRAEIKLMSPGSTIRLTSNCVMRPDFQSQVNISDSLLTALCGLARYGRIDL